MTYDDERHVRLRGLELAIRYREMIASFSDRFDVKTIESAQNVNNLFDDADAFATYVKTGRRP